MTPQTIFMLCSFGAVALIAYYGSSFMLSREHEQKRVKNRLSGLGSDSSAKADAAGAAASLPLLQQLGQAAAQPFMPKTREAQSSLRRSLAFAGIYAPSAIKMVTGCKVILLGLGLFFGYAIGALTGMFMLGLSLGGLFGYLLPVFWLKIRIRANRNELEGGLPDVLDLLVVCVEAGLTVDAAMQRVGQELALAHAALSRELMIAHMETRVGLSRGEALRNMAARTGVPGIQSLVAMLIQSERFGTSIAQALRIHADSLRQARQFAAEEQAARATVKLSFPLVLFIFPATFIVLAGPTVIELMRSPLFN